LFSCIAKTPWQTVQSWPIVLPSFETSVSLWQRKHPVVRVGAPGHVHVRKDIAFVDCLHGLDGPRDLGAPRHVEGGVGRPVMRHNVLGNRFEVAIRTVRTGQRFDGDPSDSGQIGCELPRLDRPIDGIVRCTELVAGPVVTIETVHRACDRFGRAVEFGGERFRLVHGYGAVVFLHANLDDPLEGVVHRFVGHFAALGKVPTVDAIRRRRGAHVHDQDGLLGRVGVVVGEMRNHADGIARKRPRRRVAILAGLARGPQRLVRRGNGRS